MTTIMSECHGGRRRHCGARCHGATGPKCICICGGRYHGRAGKGRTFETINQAESAVGGGSQAQAAAAQRALFTGGVE